MGKVPEAPGGVEFTLKVNCSPVKLTLLPVPVVTILPKLIMLGVFTPEPELVLYVIVRPPSVTDVVVF